MRHWKRIATGFSRVIVDASHEKKPQEFSVSITFIKLEQEEEEEEKKDYIYMELLTRAALRCADELHLFIRTTEALTASTETMFWTEMFRRSSRVSTGDMPKMNLAPPVRSDARDATRNQTARHHAGPQDEVMPGSRC